MTNPKTMEIPFFDVQFLRKKNPTIVNGKMHHWHSVRRFAVRSEAESYLVEMKKGAKNCNLHYKYRVKSVQAVVDVNSTT